jgi:hypothetical protein
MNINDLHEAISRTDTVFGDQDRVLFELPEYDPATHYVELTRSGYFRALLVLRHNIKSASDI